MVYLMHAPDTGYTKIGHSKNPEERVRQIRGSGIDAELTHVFVGAYNEEQALHAKYHAKRVRGEWFALTKEDIEEIVSQMQSDDRAIMTKMLMDAFAKIVERQPREGLMQLVEDIERIPKGEWGLTMLDHNEAEFLRVVDEVLSKWGVMDEEDREGSAFFLISRLAKAALMYPRWCFGDEDSEDVESEDAGNTLTDGEGI